MSAAGDGDGGPLVAVCLKWVDHRPEVRLVGGSVLVQTDARSSGLSEADGAALEWALRAAERCRGQVRAVTAGPPEAEAVLREALACGAADAIRVDLPTDVSSSLVAAALEPTLEGAEMVWCGDLSLDRGSGSVPAYLAAELGLPQALGLLGVTLRDDGRIEALRRLDGGRRERLAINGGRAVLSVEGATARLRRPGVRAALDARTADITVVAGPPVGDHRPPLYRPFRPPARVLAPPQGTTLERLGALTQLDAPAGRGEVVEGLAAEDAAARILRALRAWGYGPAD